MTRRTLIEPTPDALSSVDFSIAPMMWSPDADMTKGVTVSTSGLPIFNDYDGRALSPRQVTVMLIAARGDGLPEDAEVIIEVRTHDATYELDGVTVVDPEQYETIAVLTPARKLWSRSLPMQSIRARKVASATPYGAVIFGMPGVVST
jgi:hypothetical protein